ncbi:MAG TPA: tryptophan synthase subunit alpha [Bacteroidota bacterium]|nr:tryptophan synthase subunit alpha [Bacteroidota bacterium]
MNRIGQTFERLSSSGKKALIPYVTPEFPFRNSTASVLRAIDDAGADLIEVGIPFSDPLADGTTIQRSSEVARLNGATIPVILDAVSKYRKAGSKPLLLMGYYNPILHFGVRRFAAACSDAGVDGLIVPDLPPEEAGELREECRSRAISNVFLLAPTTSQERIRLIDDSSTDFSYCVSVTGVTGARTKLGSNGMLDEFLKKVRANVRKRFVVGFGISNAGQVGHIWQFADGAVVGSALVDAMAQSRTPEEAASNAAGFVRNIRPQS